MSNFLAGAAFCVVAGWVGAEVTGRAIVYSDEGRTQRFESCKDSNGGNFGCVLDAMFPSSSNSSGIPGKYASQNQKDAYNVALAWRNGTLTEEQMEKHGGCVTEAVDSALPERNYAEGVRDRSIQANIRSCIVLSK